MASRRAKPNRGTRRRSRSIGVSVHFLCHAIPARWAIVWPGTLSYRPARVGQIAIDPWEVRQTFISLSHDNEQLLDFLNSIGSWDLMPSVSIRDYWEWQQIFQTVDLHPTSWRTLIGEINREKFKRLCYIPNHYLALDRSGDFKKAIFSCANLSVLDAIIATVHFDEVKMLRRRARTSRSTERQHSVEDNRR